MDIVIACGAMPFGPATLEVRSLGGSETAALMLGKSLAARGHNVKMFCNLPDQTRPDFFPGGKAEDGVMYATLDQYRGVCALLQHDLVIIVRDPGLAAIPVLARKKVLWSHDIYTKRGMQKALEQMEWSVDQIWAVSEWHRQQIHTTTGYPLENIVALRNGIVKVDTIPGSMRSTNQLIFAARPERGLDNLIQPGGVMDNLPDYNLVVCMYDHFPDHMRPYYEQIMRRMAEMPNVTFLGAKPQRELRQLIKESAAYIYPTQFEETSCILARECIEQATPFLTTDVGALRETLKTEGFFFEDWYKNRPELDAHFEPLPAFAPGTPAWCKQFSHFVRSTLEDIPALSDKQLRMTMRDDLYWDGVAVMVEQNAAPKMGSGFSRAWSLMQDGDVIAAREYLMKSNHDDPPEAWSPGEQQVWHEIDVNYPFLKNPGERGYKSQKEYYEWVYNHKRDKADSELVFRTDATNPRIEAIAAEVEKLPPGARIVEYGCGPGHLLAALAVRFPDKMFVGVEISHAAVEVLNDGAHELNLTNLFAEYGEEGAMSGTNFHAYDAVIISEVLEHVKEPWETARVAEMMCRPGGKMIITTPFGSWEQNTIRQQGKWHERAHIWHLDQPALMKMFGHRKDVSLLALPVGMDNYGRPVGNTLCTYQAEDNVVTGSVAAPRALDPFQKALDHIARQTVQACVIAYNNEDTIKRMLDSIQHQVQMVRIAHGPSTDGTLDVIYKWIEEHPWVMVEIIAAPKIEPRKFGFDDARNMSLGYHGETEWFIWIDTDEYISGNFSKYLSNSALTGYIIPQHHFTCEPRGVPTQIDRPARLLRTDAGYKCVGKIHEHFQIDDGVGRVWMLPDVDLGHVGYVNEGVRQSRFHRNFAFLEWDHETANARKLHHFLWFRDIVHRLRILIQRGDLDGARALAAEGESYYNAHWEDFLTYGQGLQMGLAYISEIRGYLNKGLPMKITVQFEDKSAAMEGRFESYDEIDRLMKKITAPEMEERASRYF